MLKYKGNIETQCRICIHTTHTHTHKHTQTHILHINTNLPIHIKVNEMSIFVSDIVVLCSIIAID